MLIIEVHETRDTIANLCPILNSFFPNSWSCGQALMLVPHVSFRIWSVHFQAWGYTPYGCYLG